MHVAAARAAELPVACTAGTCGPNVPAFVSSGQISAVQSGNTLGITQRSDGAILNWRSFNVSRDARVSFSQPDASSVAINRIFDSDPSRILGALDANGRVYLINQNGILFGEGAKINVGGLIASTLNITQASLDLGIARAGTQPAPAFDAFRDGSGKSLSGPITIESGASLSTQEGGQILVFAPQIDNRGTIATPGGQTILAAGESVFLQSSSDPNLRGLFVEVGVGGTVTNGAAATTGQSNGIIGQIVAERGNVTLAGLAVNQLGRVSATTSVRSGGSIRLLARDGGNAQVNSGFLTATNGGELTLGANSITEVSLVDAPTDRTVDVNTQPRSAITMDGRRVNILGHAVVSAASGDIAVTARRNTLLDLASFVSDQADDSRIYVAEGAKLDVSGVHTELPMESNVIAVELRGSQLANSPDQRNGALRGQTVMVDVRATGTRSDGSVWHGTPLGDVSGDISTIQRDVAERSVTGGTIALRGAGDVLVASGATLDVSGGQIDYAPGFLNTSQLLGADGRVYNIADADPSRDYVAVLKGPVVQHERWGITETFASFLGSAPRVLQPGYVQGADAGSVTVVAPRALIDGSIDAATIVGRLQRQPPAALAGTGRPFDQTPLPGALVLGNASGPPDNAGFADYAIGSVTFAAGSTLPGLLNLDGTPFAPLSNDPLPASLGGVRIDPRLLDPAKGGVGRVSIFANGSVTLPVESTLDLGTGGSLTLTASSIDLAGSFHAPGGSVTATAGATHGAQQNISVTVRSGASIDVAGRWVNDQPLALGEPVPSPLFTSGGSISLRAATIDIRSGSTLDASGGAWLDNSGSLTAGVGGRISLASVDNGLTTTGAPPVSLHGSLSAFGLAQGGTLSITSPWICIAAADCSSWRPDALTFAPPQFTAGGFETYSLTGSRGVRVLTGTSVAPRELNWQLARGYLSARTGTSLRFLSTVELLPTTLRRAANLKLSATLAPTPELAFGSATFAAAGDLVIEAGANILGDVGSSIDLTTNTRMLIDGVIDAPGGRITATLTPSARFLEFVAGQGIWIGGNASLTARGAALIQPDKNGWRTGDVRKGGSVTITASRGSIVTQPGSVIDVSGGVGEVDMPNHGPGPGLFAPTVVYSDAGRVALTAAESMVLSGDIHAAGLAPDGSVAGGRIDIALDPSSRGTDPLGPMDPRTIEILGSSPGLLAVDFGSAIPPSLFGRALVPAPLLTASKADSLSFHARDIRDFIDPSLIASYGQISLSGDVVLAPRARLILDAPIIESTGGRTSLSASYVSLGNTDLDNQVVPTDVHLGTGTLEVKGGLVDLVGRTLLDNFASVRLQSSGDLRVNGVQPGRTGFDLVGGLDTPASLTLAAQQIYPTTFSSFVIRSLATSASRSFLTVESMPGTPGDVLSAAASLSLEANVIEQRGTLRAPIGTIRLAADEVTLAPTSVTSTTAAGLAIPFGMTQAGADWVYTLPGGQVLVFGGSGHTVPAQRIELDAGAIDFQTGATVDLRGGGDLLAYEFVPGLTGTRDVLSPLVRPNQFAIVPSMSLPYAPYDPFESIGSALQVGDSITLQDGARGLKAGTYALLPARYALLAGAFLVTPTSGYTDIRPGETYARLDGATVVGGRRAVAGAMTQDSRSSGFIVRQGSDIQRDARYDITKATAFFAPTDNTALAAQRLPSDGGTLTLLPRDQLDLGGTLLAGAASGGRGAAVEIASNILRIVGSDTAAQNGEVVLRSDALIALNAESLLVGGRTVSSAGSTSLDVRSQNVILESGARLAAPEITLTALNGITLQGGADLTALESSSVRAPILTVNGDAAVLRIAGSSEQAKFARTNALGSTGSIRMDETTAIHSTGSALLDATSDLIAAGTLDLAGSLALGAPTITLGDAPVGTAGLVLAPQVLGAFGLSELVLRASSTIDVYGVAPLRAHDISISTPGLRASNASADLDIVGDSLRLLGGATSPTTLTPGSGRLSAAVRRLYLDTGAFALDGFGDARFAVTEDATFGSGALSAADALRISARRVVGLDGSTYGITAGGALTLDAVGATTAAATEAAGIGARLTLQGQGLAALGRIDLPAGIVSMTSVDGPLTLGPSAVIDVRGVTGVFDGVGVAAPGGQVALTSRTGDIDIAQGSLIDVSAADGSSSRGGILSLLAPLGTVSLGGSLHGAAPSAALGAALHLDAYSMPSVATLTGLLGNDFSAERTLRLRGPGDLVLPEAQRFGAARVDFAADQGAIRILGTIDASGVDGGNVRLYARDEVQVSGSVLAGATSGQRGGRVDLGSALGGVRLTAESIIDASASSATATDAGQVHIRVPRAALDTLIDGVSGNEAVALDGTVSAGRYVLEGFAAYDDADGLITAVETAATPTNPWFADATAFMTNTPAYATALGLASRADFRIVPGVEVRSAGSLTVQSDWSLFNWRFDGAPGALTLRANGDLRFSRSLSDGFALTAGPAAFLLAPTGDSWSYSLSAGNDLSAVNPLATRTPWSAGPAPGNFSIAAGVVSLGQAAPVPIMVRTGTGSIDVSAAADFILGNRASVLYTAGVPGSGIALTGGASIGGRAYPVDGGNISLDVGGNIVGAPSNQLVTDWLWRMGRAPTWFNSAPTAWTVNFARFEQNVAALAGGDVRILAGGNITNFSASVPSIGRQVGGTTAVDSKVEVIGGGDLDVRAGGSILGGGYYVGLGHGLLSAGDDFAEGPPPGALPSGFAPWLALGDGTLDVVARRRVAVGAITNPTLVSQGRSQNVVPNIQSSFFSTYSDSSALNLLATGGDLTFGYREVGLNQGSTIDLLTSINFGGTDQFVLRVLPPSVRATSLKGDLQINGNETLFPSPVGNLDLFAGGSVKIGSSTVSESASLWLSDADPLGLGTIAKPTASISLNSTPYKSLLRIDFAIPEFRAAAPLHGAANRADGLADPIPTRIVASTGDVQFESSSRVFSPKPLRVVAGRDILDAWVSAYNLDDSSVSSVIAGRDVTFSAGRDAETGAILSSVGVFEVSGPGRFEVLAGRNVDLGTSRGFATLGNLVDSALPETGASISVVAGIAGREPAYDAFIDKYLKSSTDYDADLISYVAKTSGASPGRQQALADFGALPRSQQRGLIERVFVAEIRAGGRIAAGAGPHHDDYTRAFAALETLYPGSNPDLGKHEQNPYVGDIRLFFSRIYTLDGGDVNLFAPGGGINVGLSTPPAAFGLSKSASDLGIVAQSTGSVSAVLYADLQVNESRVFAADGGNILVWSTRGDIDAGRGAKTAISAPAPVITFDKNGRTIVNFPAALTGSGIQTLATSAGKKPGDVDLFAPRGIVNAGDAGIVAGNLTIGATAVLGADNISVSGVSVGVPVDTGGFGAALTGASSVAAGATNTATDTVAQSRQEQTSSTPLADQALGFLDVFVTGFGEPCDSAKEDCRNTNK